MAFSLPSWLAAATGAADAMKPGGLDSFVSGIGPGPGWMDAMHGIGHSMVSHYRQGLQDAHANQKSPLDGLPPIEKVALHFQPQAAPTDPTMGTAQASPTPAPQMAAPAQPQAGPPVSFIDPNAVANILAKNRGDMIGGIPMGLAGTAFR